MVIMGNMKRRLIEANNLLFNEKVLTIKEFKKARDKIEKEWD